MVVVYSRTRQKVRSSFLGLLLWYFRETSCKILSLASPLEQLAVLSIVFFINAPAQNLYLLFDVCCAVVKLVQNEWLQLSDQFFSDAIIKMNSNQRSEDGTLRLMFALWYQSKEISLHFEAPRGTTSMHVAVSMEYKPSAPNVGSNWCRNPNVRVQWGWTVSKDLLRWITAQNMNIS